ncbi:5-dehydro-2-deoxygluconokinase [Oceaniovalibus sp. ACAM 378]|uniref:bifunctional 5-dehydro-2-deoxygluconokinase/5-dehydro-2- deoxyphosphogluconate aldolase n=1 Tax=Oceaniovalibus sp. ACAM 378 TaxID=2599923 RepID=UPI0011D88975|nr:5-dehydro-2-deoxygluconokinase [Oceaniovalibus sp. ACAM 378]TYB86754.1 5-dehydro-2-deoxygluconokinase [Oceaniovalibus sp. ACAM 378]
MLDLITIGRSSVDLYGMQIGGRLEDMTSFRKYVGGSPCNIAIGAARLGLRSALISRVGDEAMGRFIREQLEREGCETRGLITDPERLTAFVLLGIRDEDRFPLIFLRENCADMALCEEDIDAEFITSARTTVATGTHLSHPRTEAAVIMALTIARNAGRATALDIDYRPNLWGLGGHDTGEARYQESGAVTAKLQSTLHLFDLIVGTEEEFHIAGGTTDTLEALRRVRGLCDAVLVCKRGPMGATVFDGAIPDSLDAGIHGKGFAVEVFNVLGAGDGFMAGLLKGWIEGETWETALTYANACGALAVSRHGCAPAYPSLSELKYFLATPITDPALRHDPALEQIHWSTLRRKEWPTLRAFAFDHRSQFEALAKATGAPAARIPEFKQLCLAAALRVADGRDGYGILCDDRLGRAALHAAAETPLWIGRPVEVPASRPLELEIGPDFGSALIEWPVDHTVKVLCHYHPDDPDDLKQQQEACIIRLADAARQSGLDLLLEIIVPGNDSASGPITARAIDRFYELGVWPDWWKLAPLQSAQDWQRVCNTISGHDPHCRGVVVLGLGEEESVLTASFTAAACQPLVKGFAVGRTIFGATAERWFAGQIDDETAIAAMSGAFARLSGEWDAARNASQVQRETT